MLDYFFYFMSALMVGCLFIAFYWKRLEFGFFGVVLLLLIGISINSSGVDFVDGTNFACSTDCTDCNTSPLYLTYTTYNNTWMWIIGSAAQWGGMAGLLGLFGVIIAQFYGKR